MIDLDSGVLFLLEKMKLQNMANFHKTSGSLVSSKYDHSFDDFMEKAKTSYS